MFWYLELFKSSGTATIERRELGFMTRVSDFLDHVTMAVAQRRFFISRKGYIYIGLAPLGAEVGDHICVLAGGRVPSIVRAVQQSDDHVTSRFVCRFLAEKWRLIYWKELTSAFTRSDQIVVYSDDLRSKF
ncbi:hypothetical protein GGR58DRAFT_12309 [Xylaria digitata]|nr:hypothetical protein GGR58DRAFT_12309 [Xylaria digitata]